MREKGAGLADVGNCWPVSRRLSRCACAPLDCLVQTKSTSIG